MYRMVQEHKAISLGHYDSIDDVLWAARYAVKRMGYDPGDVIDDTGAVILPWEEVLNIPTVRVDTPFGVTEVYVSSL